jgi:conjugal transfer pilus assembly protein TraI
MSFAKTLERWLRHEGEPARPGVPAVLGGATRGSAARPAPGECEIFAVGLDELLADHADLIGRLRIAYGGEEGGFENHLAPLIARFAAFVHLLPATRNAHFRRAGGNGHCELEVGFHALQAADAQIFSGRGTVQARRAAAPRWRAAAFATGLCLEVYRPVFGAAVYTDDGARWNPLLMPLLDWLQRRGCDGYTVRWAEASIAPRAAMLAVLPQILAPPLLEFLAEPDRTILDHAILAIAGPPGAGQTALASIVEQTLSRVVARDLRLAPIPYPTLPTAAGSAAASQDDVASAGGPEVSAPCGAQSQSMERVTSATSGPTLAEPVMPDEAIHRPGEPSAPVDAVPTPPEAPRRTLAIPPTLNPAVAEALSSLLAPPPGEPLGAGIEISPKGIYVPLALWAHRGLDTGLVVGALHEARLLVLQGGRKVWRGDGRDAEAPGIMLNASLLA